VTAALRPFVDRPVGDVAAATALAVSCCRELGLGQPRLVRVGMNALFAAGDVIVRVGRPSAPAGLALELADALQAGGIRVPVPAAREVWLDGELAATCWGRIEPATSALDWEMVGAAVRAVHGLAAGDLPPGYPLPSPAGFPWWDFDGLIDEVGELLDPAARSGLEDAIDRNRGWDAFDPAGIVICHGDVHPGNLLMTPDGPVLLDWDLMCRAPAGWDHAMLLTLAERWGGDPAVYPAFAAGYGRRFDDDPAARGLAELRNVAATLMRVRAGRHDQAAAAEAERRLALWRGDPRPPQWVAQ
jgi:hypothetical protein